MWQRPVSGIRCSSRCRRCEPQSSKSFLHPEPKPQRYPHRPEPAVLKLAPSRGEVMSTKHSANIDIAAALGEAQELYRARNPKSLAQYQQACAALPGGNTRSAIFVEPFPLTMARGEGSRLWDLDGHEYVDFLSEVTAGLFGHCPPLIRRAIDQALDGGVNLGAHGAAEARFAAAICARFPSIELVRFTNSGTEANLMAVSAACAITGRNKVLVFKGGYHGGVFYFRGHGSLLNAPFEYLFGKYNDLAAVEELVQPHR